MKLEEYQSFLDDRGIAYKKSGRSLALRYCPACGEDDYKVLLKIDESSDVFLGKCFHGKCGQTYSSITYLEKNDVPRNEAFALHGRDSNTIIRHIMIGPRSDAMLNVSDYQDAQEGLVIKDTDISEFLNIGLWKEHPVAQYAIKRGWVEEFEDSILMDVKTNSVVFVIENEDGEVEGFQKRFKTPWNPKFKTQTSFGFERDRVLRLKKKDADTLVVCEGPFTALSAWHYGFYGAATLGSAINDQQLEEIRSISKTENLKIAVAYENDKAGWKFYNRIANFFSWYDEPVHKLLAEHGKDLNDSWQIGKGFKMEVCKIADPAIPNITLF